MLIAFALDMTTSLPSGVLSWWVTWWVLCVIFSPSFSPSHFESLESDTLSTLLCNSHIITTSLTHLTVERSQQFLHSSCKVQRHIGDIAVLAVAAFREAECALGEVLIDVSFECRCGFILAALGFNGDNLRAIL